MFSLLIVIKCYNHIQCSELILSVWYMVYNAPLPLCHLLSTNTSGKSTAIPLGDLICTIRSTGSGALKPLSNCARNLWG